MKKLNQQKIIIPTLILSALVFLGILGIRVVNAKDNGSYPPIIQKLVERFNLDAAEVQQVFDEDRQEREVKHQAHFEERLAQAVAEGKITGGQKDAILAKKTEMQEKLEGLKDLSPEERREAMSEFHDEMKAWTEENGIGLTPFFMPGFRRPRGGPPGWRIGK